MSTDLTFYTHPMSRGAIIRWMLEEVGAPYDTRVLLFDSTMKAPEYLAINPMGKVPAIVHGDTVVTECAAICAYLADAFPAAGLAPPLDRRGAYYRWLFFAAGPLEAAVTNKALGFEVPAESQATAGYGNFELVMSTLEKAVDRDGYLAGDTFSAADLYVGAHIGWGLQFGTLDKRPAFERYAARLAERPARQRAESLDAEAARALG